MKHWFSSNVFLMEGSEKLTIRTGIYVRVSTDDQRDNGYSIDSQLRMIKEYCEKNNYDIIDVYDDGGYSGRKNLPRQGLHQHHHGNQLC